MLIYGINPVREAIRSGRYRPTRLYALAARKGVRGQIDWIVGALAEGRAVETQWVEAKDLDRLAGGGNHQGVAAEVPDFVYARPEVPPGPDRSPIVLLDGITDPQNLGNILRTTVAFGTPLVVLPEDRAARVTATVARVSSGAAFHARVAVTGSLVRAADDFREAGYRLLALDAAGTDSPDQAGAGDVALVLGSEDKGVRRALKERCDARVRLPTDPAFPQLNAATALAVALYAVRARVA
jgi:23S rRNA (guanosine2251-2'-O)-methyltransferase